MEGFGGRILHGLASLRRSRRAQGLSPSPNFVPPQNPVRLDFSNISGDSSGQEERSLEIVNELDETNYNELPDQLNEVHFVPPPPPQPDQPVYENIPQLNRELNQNLNPDIIIVETSDDSSVDNNNSTTNDMSLESQGPPNRNNNMENQVIRHVSNRVPNAVIDPGLFQGTTTENIGTYLDQFEIIARANDWNEDQKCKYLPCFLRGSARLWYNNFLRTPAAIGLNWNALTQALRGHFNSKSYVELAETKLSLRFQGETEPFETYYYDVLNFCNIVDPNMAELQKVRHLIRGMRSSLMEKIYPLGCSTAAELLQHAITHEAARFASAQRTLMATLFDPNLLGSSSAASVTSQQVGGGSVALANPLSALTKLGALPAAPPPPPPPPPPPVATVETSSASATPAGVTSADTTQILKELTDELKALRAERSGQPGMVNAITTPSDSPYSGGYSDQYRGGFRSPPSRAWNGLPICTFCGGRNHNEYSCFYRFGYPRGGRGNNRGRFSGRFNNNNGFRNNNNNNNNNRGRNNGSNNNGNNNQNENSNSGN